MAEKRDRQSIVRWLPTAGLLLAAAALAPAVEEPLPLPKEKKGRFFSISWLAAGVGLLLVGAWLVVNAAGFVELTPDSVANLTQDTVANLTPDAIAKLTPDAIAKLTAEDPTAPTQEQIVELFTTRLGEFRFVAALFFLPAVLGCGLAAFFGDRAAVMEPLRNHVAASWLALAVVACASFSFARGIVTTPIATVLAALITVHALVGVAQSVLALGKSEEDALKK